MRVWRADAMGFCFGVRDALAIARSQADPAKVTIYGELVHNEQVLAQLQTRGFSMVSETERRQIPESSAVLITAHGISDRERRRLESAGKSLIDTTCPLVRRIHRAAQSLESDGFHVCVVGRRDHVEVRGIVDDLTSCDVLERVEEVGQFPYPKLGVVCQSTTPPHVARLIVSALRIRNPSADVRFIDTICEPTRQRQEAVDRLCRIVDAMIVVGGKNSHNTRQLLERCRSADVPAWQVQQAGDLDRRWFERIATVGLTAGTSTPDEAIDEIYEALSRIPAGTPATSRRWINYFRHNAQSQHALPWDRSPRLTTSERAAVARSIQLFQLGESGQGTRLLRAAIEHAEAVGDADYPEAIRLFVKEEQRHADLLRRFLECEGLGVIGRAATDRVFRTLRHLSGLELMLAVLLTAELIAKVYYAALRDATESPLLRAICVQILRDERWHVRFQCQRLALLRRRNGPVRRRCFRWIEAVLFRGTCLIVWATHAAVFRSAGIRFRSYWRRVMKQRALWWRLTRSRLAAGETPAPSKVP